MSTPNDGGSISPIMTNSRFIDHQTMTEDVLTPKGGLSIRDYFAAAAMQAYLSGRKVDGRDTLHEYVAITCYQYADAMLAERNKPTSNDQ